MGKRFTQDFAISQPEDFVRFVSEDFFQKEGFSCIQYNGETVWKKGVGVLTAPQFIKLSYQNGWVHLEAWIKYAILPGVYCGEMGLSGFFGFAIKEVLHGKVNALVALLNQPPLQYTAPATAAAYAGEGQPAYPAAPSPYSTAQPAAPIPVAVHNPTGKATLSLVMGLVGILAWIIPIVGIMTSILGIVSAIPGMKSTSRGQAIAGLVLSIIFLIVSIFAWIFNMLMLL